MFQKKFIIIISINVLVLNLAVGYLVYSNLFKDKDVQELPERNVVVQDNINNEDLGNYGVCLQECKDYVDQEISSIDLAGVVTPQPTPTSSPELSPKVKTRKTQYITVPGSGSTLNNDWTDLSGTHFYFDPGDYPGIIEAKFQANMKLVNGNGKAWVRLYDVTHEIGVANSEADTTSQTTTWVASGLINFWSGRNLYRVQAKSLTADTVVYESGNLKIITEN